MMTFLDEVAQELYAKHGARVGELVMLFPSRRARLFFVEALGRIADKPIWQPRYQSLDELVAGASGMVVGERIRLVTELYKIYSKYHNETFDKFYFWGEILLSDFDMIDKYLVDAQMLFRNISDIKEIESDLSYMTPEQLQIIEAWTKTISDGADASLEKQRFLKIWNSLGAIYSEYRARLRELGITYVGMMQREAVEKIKGGEYSFDDSQSYAVVGFNALSACEKYIFKSLAVATSVEFFWDYDGYYVDHKEQEAGMFLRDNISMFRSDAPVSSDNMVRSKERVEVVAAASNALQCKYVANIIEQIAASGAVDKRTAIVLTDESLLTPLLHSLPALVEKVNVTMGYPLRQSLAYVFVERLLELQTHARLSRKGVEQFYHVDVEGLLAHPYITASQGAICREVTAEITKQRMISVEREVVARGELLSKIFRRCTAWSELSAWLAEILQSVMAVEYSGDDSAQRLEFMASIVNHIKTLHNTIESCDVELTQSIYLSLLRRQIQNLRIPFEGEPLEGVQIMGILETRALDFDNVIILSMTDDNFPGNLSLTPSYIPYNLRAAYSLPTPEHHEGVYAYYFYRLIQRAQRVWMLYCAHSDDKLTTGEPSRYIRQMEYESGLKIDHVKVDINVNIVDSESIEVAKSEHVLRKMARFTAKDEPFALSPTALFRYVACPLRFYFYSVAGIRVNNDLTDDIDAPMFGNILHEAMQTLYKDFVGHVVTAEALKELLKGDGVERAIDLAIAKRLLMKESVDVESYSGDIVLVKEIVARYIRGGVIAYDIAHPGFRIEGVECDVELPIALSSGERILLKGISDRVDTLGDGRMRVVDYKSGEKHTDFESVDALFNGAGKARQSNIIQALLYSMMLTRRDGVRVSPALYYVRSMNNPEYSPILYDASQKMDVEDYGDSVGAEFEQNIVATVEEIFDKNIPFRQCEDREHTCQFCDYLSICSQV